MQPLISLSSCPTGGKQTNQMADLGKIKSIPYLSEKKDQNSLGEGLIEHFNVVLYTAVIMSTSGSDSASLSHTLGSYMFIEQI